MSLSTKITLTVTCADTWHLLNVTTEVLLCEGSVLLYIVNNVYFLFARGISKANSNLYKNLNKETREMKTKGRQGYMNIPPWIS